MSCCTRRRTSSTLRGQLDDVERVQDGPGVVELVIDGVLVPAERVQGGDLHPGPEGLAPIDQPASCTPFPERPGTRSSRRAQVRPCASRVRSTSPITSFGPRPPGSPGRHVVPLVLIDSEDPDALETRRVDVRGLQQSAGSPRTPSAGSRPASGSRSPRRARDGAARSPTDTPWSSTTSEVPRRARAAPRTTRPGSPRRGTPTAACANGSVPGSPLPRPTCASSTRPGCGSSSARG